ncbi:hypothetical protein [Sinorhizobium sp. BG8]|uniref:hypothetical protein n=1 Tax=Sinorhizobium sp. BG8 TaxID=2613773 RepID=UPI00193CE83B|nr:hypothetical protein [Sinorhizobium sp. BG8]
MSKIDEPSAPEKKAPGTGAQDHSSDRKADEKDKASSDEEDARTLHANKIIGNG